MLAKQLRDAIRKSGLSENELGRRSGVSQSTINRFVRGRDIQLGSVQRLCEALGLDYLDVKCNRRKR